MAELVLTNLHAGGKFGQGAYKYSGGLHGVGAKCVNALSEWFKVEVSRDGKVHTMEFERGKTTRKLEVIGKSKSTGTLVTFKPDSQIFTITTEFNFNMLSARLRELAFLNPGVEIRLVDDREDDKSETFFYRDGIEQFVRQLGKNKQLVHAKPIVIANKTDDVFVDVVIQYNDSYNDQILCYANSIPNVDGGAHLTGFRTALTRRKIICLRRRIRTFPAMMFAKAWWQLSASSSPIRGSTRKPRENWSTMKLKVLCPKPRTMA